MAGEGEWKKGEFRGDPGIGRKTEVAEVRWLLFEGNMPTTQGRGERWGGLSEEGG